MVAIALAAALLTIAGTARTRVLDELSQRGPLAWIRVAAAAPRPDQVDEDDARPGLRRDLDDAARRRIAALPQLRAVVPILTAPVLVLPPARARFFFDTVVVVDLRRAPSSRSRWWPGGFRRRGAGSRWPSPRGS